MLSKHEYLNLSGYNDLNMKNVKFELSKIMFVNIDCSRMKKNA